jgi:AraC family transcriptional regulator
MTEAAKFPETTGAPIGEPRIEAGAPMLMIGLARRYQLQDHEGIPGQWQSFMAMAHEIPHRVPAAPVSVCMNMDEEGRYDYVCAVEVTKVVRVPDGLSEVRVPAQTYAAFTHTGHVTGLPNTYAAIFSDWFPKQSRIPSGGPSLEKHLATFDPRTGMGGVEIWIPVD